MDAYPDSPLRPVASHWVTKIALAIQAKARRFGKDAELAMKFFSGPCDWLYGKGVSERGMDADAQLPSPTFQMSLNKTAELVQLFGPVLYHKNPNRQVTPRKWPAVPPEVLGFTPDDPMAAQQYQMLLDGVARGRATDRARADLLAVYLNYTPNALDLKTESRWAIDEAIIKGMGLLYQETYRPPGAQFQLVGSFYDTVDNLVIDPDAESLRDAKWCARRCVHPVWQAEREYGLPPGTLRGNLESTDARAAVAVDPIGDYRRKTGQTADLIEYWKVYSKMGAGGRLAGVAAHVREPLEAFGDFCFLVVAADVPFPLNLPPALTDAPGAIPQVQQRLQWPTPYWADDAWPFTPISFHGVPRDVWPMSHLAPGFGELKFLNWMYSFIAGKITTTCRDFIAVQKGLSEEIKATILSGRDLSLIEIDKEHGTIDQVVQFLKHEPFNGDIWRVTEAISNNFDRRVGLTELMYGESARQLRSAAEAEIKSGQLNVRPDDMANKVEDAMGLAARQEALAARWHLRPEDVLPVVGPLGAAAWETLVYAADPASIIHSLEYRIEAGSVRKPNRERDAQNLKDAMQVLFQPLLNVCLNTGNVGPVNALLREWGKTIDFDVEGMGVQFPELPPPQPAAPPGAGPAPAGPAAA